MLPIRRLNMKTSLAALSPAIFLLILLVSFVGAGCGSEMSGSDGSDYRLSPAALKSYKAASTALEVGDLPTAVTRVEEAAALEPEAPQILMLKGMAYNELERYPEARAAFEALAERYPRYPDAWLKLGNVAVRQERFEEAAQHYRNEIAVQPTRAAWYNLGTVLEELGKPQEAEDAYKQAVALDPAYALGYAGLADLADEEGDVDAALSYASQALQHEPDDLRLKERVGFMLSRAGRNEQALPILEEVVAEQPWNYQARYNLGQALQRAGRSDEAKQQLERAESDREGQSKLRRIKRDIVRHPQDARLHFALGVEYQRWQQLDEAMKSYRRAEQLMPDNLHVQINMGTLHLHREQFDEARRRFRHIVEQDSTLATAWLNLGLVEARVGNERAAREAWRKAVALEPSYREPIAAFQTRFAALQ